MNFGTHSLVGFKLCHYPVCQCVVAQFTVWNESKYGVGVSGSLRGMSPDFVHWGQDIVSVPLTPLSHLPHFTLGSIFIPEKYVVIGCFLWVHGRAWYPLLPKDTDNFEVGAQNMLIFG